MSHDIWQELIDITRVGRKALDVTIDAHKAVIAERDALAAHVEFLRNEIALAASGLGFALRLSHARETTAMQAVDKEIGRINRASAQKPATSLAHLKAECQAEALERLFIEGQTDPDWVSKIPGAIRELRRQAEENSDE